MRRTPVLLALLLVALVPVACGGDDDEQADAPAAEDTSEVDGADGPAGTVTAEEYAEGVCTSIGGWFEGIAASTRTLAQEFTGTDDPAAGKELVLAFLDDAIGLTDDLSTDLEAAGVPDTETGPETAEKLLAGNADVRQLFADARADTEALATEDRAALETGLDDVFTSLQESATAVAATREDVLSSVDDPELTEAFEASETCQEADPAG